MKKLKIILILIAAVIFSHALNVNAANYELKELIPLDITTSVKGEYFLYKGIRYEDGNIYIERVRNNFYEEKPLSISIGLFDSKELNIGTIIYCDEEKVIKSKKSEDNIVINISNEYLGSDKSLSDIKYISVISDNGTCRKSGYHDYLGQKVEDIGKINALEKDEDVDFFVNILTVVVIILVVLFLYQFLFTNKYANMDNDDVRKVFKHSQKEIKAELKKENKKKAKEAKAEAARLEKEEVQRQKDELEARRKYKQEHYYTDMVVEEEEQKSIGDLYK